LRIEGADGRPHDEQAFRRDNAHAKTTAPETITRNGLASASTRALHPPAPPGRLAVLCV